MQKNRYDKFLNLSKILEDHMQDATLCQRKIDQEIRSMNGSLGRHRKDINASLGQVNALVDRVVTLEEEIVEAKKVNRRLERKVSVLEVVTDD